MKNVSPSSKAAPKKNERGPLETVSGKGGLRVPIYEETRGGKMSYRIIFYADGKRVKERASTIESARERAKAIIQNLTTGAAHVRDVTAREAEILNQVVEMLSPLNISITSAIREFVAAKTIAPKVDLVDAVRAYQSEQERLTRPQMPVGDVVAELTSALESQGRSARYREDMTSRLKVFAKAFKTNIGSVRVEEIDRWLIGLKVKPRTKNNYRASVATLFSFARNRGYLPRDTKTEAELAMVATNRGGAIGIYSPDALKTMLAGLPERFRAHVALGGLAGLRTSEIGRLDWKDINIPGKFIVVARDKAKTAQRRIVPMSKSLIAWIKPIAEKAGPVRKGCKHDSTFLRALSEAMKIIEVESVDNGLRHSYASYRLASVKSADQVALEMGNSPRKLFANYREITTEAEARRWFSVMPCA
jgi:integrase